VNALRRLLLRSLVLGGATLGLTSCGFRLRGPLQLPFVTVRTNLSGTEVGRALRAELVASGARFVEPPAVLPGQPPQPPAPADIVLEVLQDQRERVVVGVNSRGELRELTLRYRFKFRVRTDRGRDLITDTELLQERELSFSEALTAGKELEEGLLYRDMQSDIVRQVMRRLSLIKGLPASVGPGGAQVPR
jgi:LPS-assembly lipoprotein